MEQLFVRVRWREILYFYFVLYREIVKTRQKRGAVLWLQFALIQDEAMEDSTTPVTERVAKLPLYLLTKADSVSPTAPSLTTQKFFFDFFTKKKIQIFN